MANERDAAFVDANAELTQPRAAAASASAASPITSAFLTGGLFSYDGVHPTAFGYAYIANIFIDAINDKYGGEIPPVNLYPFVFGTASAASSLTGPSSSSHRTIRATALDRRRPAATCCWRSGVPKWIVDGTKPSPRDPGRRGTLGRLGGSRRPCVRRRAGAASPPFVLFGSILSPKFHPEARS